MEEMLIQKIARNADDMIESIKAIVRIPSVKSEPLPQMPYGKAIHEALIAVLALAQEMGFETENVDGHMGIVKYGEGKDYIGIIGHLDVVEAGDGWKHAPFGAEEEKGRIYGRGILDNKGAILSCLYALYAIKQLHITLQHPIWILFGTDEESGFHDLQYYLRKHQPPIMGFTPDCKYPVVYGERGRCTLQVSADPAHYDAFCTFVNAYLQQDNGMGKCFDLEIEDQEFGKMQLSRGKLHREGEKLCVAFTFAYPFGIDAETIMRQVRSFLPDGLMMQCLINWEPVRFAKDGFLCRTLQSAYEKITGADGTPVTTSGGTYAKLMPHIVPFGPSFPGQKGIAHLPDEWMDKEDLIKNAMIYGISMLRLGSEGTYEE